MNLLPMTVLDRYSELFGPDRPSCVWSIVKFITLDQLQGDAGFLDSFFKSDSDGVWAYTLRPGTAERALYETKSIDLELLQPAPRAGRPRTMTAKG